MNLEVDFTPKLISALVLLIMFIVSFIIYVKCINRTINTKKLTFFESDGELFSICQIYIFAYSVLLITGIFGLFIEMANVYAYNSWNYRELPAYQTTLKESQK